MEACRFAGRRGPAFLLEIHRANLDHNVIYLHETDLEDEKNILKGNLMVTEITARQSAS